jgi:hypothetical protein
MAVAAEVLVAEAGAAAQYSFHSRVDSAQYSKAGKTHSLSRRKLSGSINYRSIIATICASRLAHGRFFWCEASHTTARNVKSEEAAFRAAQ